MDRNIFPLTVCARSPVALRKESVDRNLEAVSMVRWTLPSLSARRAWIEIPISRLQRSATVVALRKESVDRNRGLSWWTTLTLQSLSARRAWIEMITCKCLKLYRKSLSARRAWIEIIHRGAHHFYLGVALRKESVDRNCSGSPVVVCPATSLSARRAWIEIR